MITASGRCHGPGCTQPDCMACKVYAWIEQLPPAPPDQEPIKLTGWQWEALKAMYPQQPDGRYRFGGNLGELSGRRVQLVDCESDATFPSAAYPQVASPDQQGAWDELAEARDDLVDVVKDAGQRHLDRMYGWLGRLFDRWRRQP